MCRILQKAPLVVRLVASVFFAGLALCKFPPPPNEHHAFVADNTQAGLNA